MTSFTRTLISHRAIKNEAMFPQKAAREQWISRDIGSKQCHDGKWREYRNAKAMSWPKSFLSSVVTPGMTSQTDFQSSTKCIIPEEAEGTASDIRKFSQTKPLLPNHSIGRLLGEYEKTPVLTESSATHRLDRTNETPVGSKSTYKRWSIDEELSIQSSSRENNNAGKNVAYRRAKGGLKDLIRLHEEEIARASGTPKACAKRLKHEDVRQYSNLSGFEDLHVQTSNNSKLLDVDKRKEVFIEKQQGRHLVESSFTDGDGNQLLTEKGGLQQQQVQFIEKGTSTDFPDVLSPTELELELKKQVNEKDDLISLLSQEKENLLCKLEEQKKVANAYQKLEDRYRRKVFELEKVLLSCRCGALGSKSPSEQDLTKHFLNG